MALSLDALNPYPCFCLNLFDFDRRVHCEGLFALLVHSAVHPHHSLTCHLVHFVDVCLI